MKTKEEIIDDFINDLLFQMDKLGIDTANCDGDDDQALIIARFVKSKLDQETSSLREQLKEKEEEIKNLNEVLDDKRRLTKEIDVILFGSDAAENPSLCDVINSIQSLKLDFESQSKLIESLAGALRDFVEDDNYGRDLINSVSREMDMFEAPKRKILIKGEEALTEYNNYKNKKVD